MDESASGAAEHRSSRRTAYMLTEALPGWVLPSVGPAPAKLPNSSSHHSSKPSRSSHRRSHPHSRSSKHKCCSVGSNPSQGPSSPQAAILEERIKKIELENVRRLNNHECLADMEYKLLYNRAREGQRLQEEASGVQKVLARRLEREQHFSGS